MPKPKKPPKFSNEEMIEQVSSMLAMRCQKRHIKAAIRKMFGRDVSSHTMESLISAGRARLIGQLDRPFAEHLSESLGMYSTIIGSSRAEPKDKIRAQERIDFILGHDAKFRKPEADVRDTAADIRDAVKEMEETMQ